MSRALNEKPNAEPLPTLASAGVTLNGRYLPPPEDKDGKMWVRTSALIHASAEDLYNMWRDVEAAPLWQEQIEKVTRTGETTSHWVMRPVAIVAIRTRTKPSNGILQFCKMNLGGALRGNPSGANRTMRVRLSSSPRLAVEELWSPFCRNFEWES